MQLEVIGTNDGPCKPRPKVQKVDSQDRSQHRSQHRSWDQSWDQSWDRSWDWSWTALDYLQSANTGPGPGTSPGTGPGTGPGPRMSCQVWSQDQCWDQDRFQDWSGLAVSGLAPVFQDRTGSQVPVPPCDRLRGTDGLVSRTSST